MNDRYIIHRPTYSLAASLKFILKRACCVALLLPLTQSPLQAVLVPSIYQLAYNNLVAKANLYANHTKNYLTAAQSAKANGNVEGIRSAANSARIFANLTVSVANQAHDIIPSAEAAIPAHNAVAWANQAASLLSTFTASPAPLPRPRRVLVVAGPKHDVANLKNQVGVVSAEHRGCCGGNNFFENGSGFIAGRYTMVTAAHGIYKGATGFAVKVIFFRNPDNEANVSRTMFTMAVRRGYRAAANNLSATRNLGAIADNDVAIGEPRTFSGFWNITATDYSLNYGLFDSNYENAPRRAGVLNPYRAAAFKNGVYKFASTTQANMDPSFRDGRRFGSIIYHNSGLDPRHSDFGPGTSGGPLVEESHESGYLWGGYTYLTVVGIVNSGNLTSGRMETGFKVFNLTDLYFLDYYTQEGPGRNEYTPEGLDERYY